MGGQFKGLGRSIRPSFAVFLSIPDDVEELFAVNAKAAAVTAVAESADAAVGRVRGGFVCCWHVL